MNVTRKKYHKNISLYYWYSTFTNLLILGPILTLFLLNKGLNFTQILTLQSISAVGVVLLEVPTGAVADLIGRKLSILLGSLSIALSLLIYIYGTNFLAFAVAELTFSLGMSFKSGADTALLYDTLKSLGQEKNYKHIQSKCFSLALLAQAPGCIIAGYVFKINDDLPMLISFCFMIITINITLFFKDIKLFQDTTSKPSYLSQIVHSGKFIISHAKIKAFVIFSMLFNIFFRAGFWFFQPYMKEVNIDIVYFGYIFALFNIVAAFSSHMADKFTKKTKGKTLISLGILLLLSFILMGLTHIWIGFIFILLQQIARGLYRPIMMSYINKHIPSEKRATIISFESLLKNLTVAITLPFIGMLMDNTTIFNVHLILSLILLVCLIMMNKYLNSKLNTNN